MRIHHSAHPTRFLAVHALMAGATMLVLPVTSSSQSLLDRPPNISGDWTGAPGTLHFNFIHRFSTSGEPERKVSNVPTFFLAAGLPMRLLAGVSYSTNSTLAPRFPNEWEFFARWAPLSEDYGAPLDLAGQVGYNNAGEGVDGEVSVARRLGPVRLIGVARALSDPFESGNVRYAFGGGGTIRLGTYVALAGDVSSLTSRDSSERVAWSAGLHLAIPLSPHTFSLQVTNTLVSTLQGVSRGTEGRRYGFEFTIPLTLRRYFGRRAEQSPSADSASRVAAPDSASVVASREDSTAVATVPPPIPAPTTNPPATLPPAAPPPVAAPRDTSRVPSAQRDTARTTSPARESVTPAKPPVSPDTARRTTSPTSPPAARVPSRSAPARTAARTVRTGMRNTSYLQSRLQVTVGTTVEWKNNDPLPHSVTAVDKSFNSGLIQPGKTYSHTFTKAGTYSFFCMPHPFMKGVIVVKGD
jgi:plastocyanin